MGESLDLEPIWVPQTGAGYAFYTRYKSYTISMQKHIKFFTHTLKYLFFHNLFLCFTCIVLPYVVLSLPVPIMQNSDFILLVTGFSLATLFYLYYTSLCSFEFSCANYVGQWFCFSHHRIFPSNSFNCGTLYVGATWCCYCQGISL